MRGDNVNATGEVERSPDLDNLKDQETFTDRWIAPATDGVKRIFKGSVEEGLQIPSVRYAHSILVRIFGGMYITSNVAESLFTVKPALRYHRTVKNGDALIHVLLYLRTELQSKSREELRTLFIEEVITSERMMRVAVTGSLHKKNKPIEQTIINACQNHQPVVIYYRDSRGKRTTRMIEPLEVEKDSYTGGSRIRAHCYLRDADRTFLLDRIVDAIPADTNLSVASCTSS
jgi:Predicted transcriptional regulator